MTGRVEQIRATIAEADRLRREAAEAEETIRLLTCGLPVRAGTGEIGSRWFQIMFPALRQHALDCRRQAQLLEDQL